MSALLESSLTFQVRFSTLPAPVAQFFQQADLAHAPRSMHGLGFDAVPAPDRDGGRKTLLAFSAERAELNLFLLTSPGMRRASERLPDVRPLQGLILAANALSVPGEPDFDWWDPARHGVGRHLTWSSGALDFIEAMISPGGTRIHFRAFG